MRSWILVAAVLASGAPVGCSPGQLGDPPSDPVSPGAVTVHLLLPPTRSFCNQVPPCGEFPHVSFSTDLGQAIDLGWGRCRMTCSRQCDVHACPTIICTGPGTGVAVTDVRYTWDGSFVEPWTCGNNIACDRPGFVPPGSYVARLCATPGTLAAATDAGRPTCTATGPAECVDLPFNLPGPRFVDVVLP